MDCLYHGGTACLIKCLIPALNGDTPSRIRSQRDLLAFPLSGLGIGNVSSWPAARLSHHPFCDRENSGIAAAIDLAIFLKKVRSAAARASPVRAMCFSHVGRFL